MWESFYTAFENNYRAALEYVFKNGLQDDFKDRLKDCLHLTENCGWGFNDTLVIISMNFTRPIGKNSRSDDIRRIIS